MRLPPLAALALLGFCSGCSELPGIAHPTAQADAMRLDWTVFFYTGLVVAAIVYALIFYPLFRWRKRNDELPPQWRRNNRIEIISVVIPLVMVIALFILTYRVENVVDALVAKPAVVVDVQAYRWSFRIAYPGRDIALTGTPRSGPLMTIPAGETTRINLTALDVNHSVWIPAFLFKRDAIPGVDNHFDLHPAACQIGEYRALCTQFCGLDHAFMTFTVRVVSPADFARWAAGARSTT